jgi:hypothetical protein
MKKLIAFLLALTLCVSLCACGGSTDETEPEETTATEQEEPSTEETEEPEEAEPSADVQEEPEPEEDPADDPEVISDALQGVWCNTSDTVLTFYAFKEDNVDTYVVNMGAGASNFLSGTYTVSVEDGTVDYSFTSSVGQPTSSTGYSNYSYDNDVLTLSSATDGDIVKLSAADILEYLTQEEDSDNTNGVVCLADLILNYYPDSAECSVATEKKAAVDAAIKAAGEAALQNMVTTYDQVQKLTWYQHKNQPQYCDICCYIYPYFGLEDDGQAWLRVVLNYTDAETGAGWVFFNKVIFSVDGENTTKSFNRSDITRDNDTEVWEIADFVPDDSEIKLLKEIANSEQTIIRFEGDNYYADHEVTSNEKEAILDVLAAYDYLTNYSE